jgi:hypothetical protein
MLGQVQKIEQRFNAFNAAGEFRALALVEAF